jgi:hypothetical protein
LTFAPLAWLKLQYFCHAGPTEVGGFGIAAPGDPLYVVDFVTVRQHVTPMTVRFEDAAVADFFDACVDQRLPPDRFARVWCHTHPSDSVTPSATDEETFANCFGRCDWALMFILGRAGTTYARLSFHASPGAQLDIPTAVDWAAWPETLDEGRQLAEQVEQWRQEYVANIHRLPEPAHPFGVMALGGGSWSPDWWEAMPWSEELDRTFYEPVEEIIANGPDTHRLVR